MVVTLFPMMTLVKPSQDLKASGEIVVTPLPYDKQAPRKEQIDELAEGYVRELERIIRLYPTQWYNYFDFWNQK